MTTKTKNSLLFNRNGRSHVALLVAKMFKRPFTTADLKEISTLFLDTKRTSQSLNTLKSNGFLVKHADGSWQITQAGIDHVYKTARASQLARTDD